MTEYLDLDDLLAAAEAAVGSPADIRDIGLLQSAVARPHATAFGEEAYPDFNLKAAALLHAIVAGHPLVDGNKRLGWVATRLFYRMNGIDVRAEPNDAYVVIVAVASGELRDVPAIAERLARWRQPLGGSYGSSGLARRSVALPLSSPTPGMLRATRSTTTRSAMPIAEFVARVVDACPPDGVVLDIPCGTGRYFELVVAQGRRVVGADQSAGMVEQARARGLADSVEQTGLQELAHVATFDGVLCIDAMEHVPPEDWPRVVDNLGRACRPAGLCTCRSRCWRTSRRIWTEPWLTRSRRGCLPFVARTSARTPAATTSTLPTSRSGNGWTLPGCRSSRT